MGKKIFVCVATITLLYFSKLCTSKNVGGFKTSHRIINISLLFVKGEYPHRVGGNFTLPTEKRDNKYCDEDEPRLSIKEY